MFFKYYYKVIYWMYELIKKYKYLFIYSYYFDKREDDN